MNGSVERNPVSAGMVRRAREWAWSSHVDRLKLPDGEIVAELPISFVGDWAEFVDAEMSDKEKQMFF